MPKEDYDELYPDEDTSKILKTTDVLAPKEKKPKKSDNTAQKERIQSLLKGAIGLLNRNLRNKNDAVEKINTAIKLIGRLR